MIRDLQQAMDRALRLHLAGALSEAESVYRSLHDENPSAFVPLHMLGVLRAQQGYSEEGAKLVALALRIDPTVAIAWYNYANILAILTRRDEALLSYDKALALDDRIDIRHQRARLLLEMGQMSQALADLDQVLASDPENLETKKDRAVILSSLGRDSEARDCYEKLLESRPNDVELLNNLGNLLRDQRQFSAALELYDRALALGRDVAEIWSNHAATLSELQRYTEALQSAAHQRDFPNPCSAWLLACPCPFAQ
jgi:tetratricopeptide (TPR) repeat protein